MTKPMELTLSLLKPHLIKNPLAIEHIKKIILNEGFIFIKKSKILLSTEQAESFYAEHREKFFFNRIITFICSGPIEAYILGRENAILKWRQLLGPTKVYRAIYSHPNSLRGLYGLSDTRNAAHGSDSEESAQKEIKILFPNFSFEDWQKNLEK